MNVSIDYHGRPNGNDPPTYQFTSNGPPRIAVVPGPTDKIEPTILIRGHGLAGKKIDLDMTLTEFRQILAAVIGSGAVPGLNHDDLAAAGRVVAACLAAVPK